MSQLTPYNYDTLPKKRMAAGCLFLNEQDELLLVKPGYKPGWEIPGGIVEADESPLACCRREVTEEIGLTLPIERLLVVDYSPPDAERTEALMFVFWGGRLSAAEVDAIQVDGVEIVGVGFFARDVLPTTLSERLRRRILAAWNQFAEGGARYLEGQYDPQ